MLQFADDTLFIGEASVQNLVVLKCILRCVELCSGLKVNFQKSKLVVVAVEPGVSQQFASFLNCKVMGIPFTYLGTPVGGRPKCRSMCDPVVNKMRSRLAPWKQKMIYFGGRLCLLKSVLSSLPLFFLSFFKMPTCVVKICTGLMRSFLWGGGESVRKIAWVKWSEVCKSKEEGGLGVKDLALFNKALLGKWLWRLRNEPKSLWCRVVLAKYGDGGAV